MPGPNWVFWTCGALLAMLGAWWFYWSLFADRSRGRRRCPRCWYELGGAPGTRCPECGRDAGREVRLFKTRRWWTHAALAVVVLVLATASALTPRVRERGLWSALPTTLVLGVEWVVGKKTVVRLSREREERIFEERLWNWQFAMIAARDEQLIRFRRTWPRDTPLLIQTGSRLARSNSSMAMGIGTPPQSSPPETVDTWLADSGFSANQAEKNPLGGSYFGRVQVSGAVGYSERTFPLPVKLVSTVDEVITPLTGAEVDEFVRRWLDLRLLKMTGTASILTSSDIAAAAANRWGRLTIGFCVEIRKDQLLVAKCRGLNTATRNRLSVRHQRLNLRFLVDPQDFFASDLTDPTWRVIIKSDPEMALRDFDGTHYWKGEFEMPLSDLLK